MAGGKGQTLPEFNFIQICSWFVNYIMSASYSNILFSGCLGLDSAVLILVLVFSCVGLSLDFMVLALVLVSVCLSLGLDSMVLVLVFCVQLSWSVLILWSWFGSWSLSVLVTCGLDLVSVWWLQVWSQSWSWTMYAYR